MTRKPLMVALGLAGAALLVLAFWGWRLGALSLLPLGLPYC